MKVGVLKVPISILVSSASQSEPLNAGGSINDDDDNKP
jgi:hypothetical protein